MAQFRIFKITVPAAGSIETIKATGWSVVVGSINLYSEFDEVPKMYFDGHGHAGQPIFPQSTYLSAEKFSKIVVEGTTESSGDEIVLLLTNDCLAPNINPNLVSTKLEKVKATFSKATNATVRSLSASEKLIENDFDAQIMYISSDVAVHYAFGVDPVPGTPFGLIQPANEKPIKIVGKNLIDVFRWASISSGTLTVQLTT